MFGFGKKKLTDQIANGIVLEVGMFQSWLIDHRGVDLKAAEVGQLILKILEREKLSYTQDQATAMKYMAMANTDFDLLRKIRVETKFDMKVSGFCQSIGIALP